MQNSNVSIKDSRTRVKPYGYPVLAPFGWYDLDSLTSEKASSSAITAGLAFGILSASNRHVSLAANVMFTTKTYKTSRLDAKITSIEIPVTIQYNFMVRSKVQPYLSAGVNSSIAVGSRVSGKMEQWIFRREEEKAGHADTWDDELPVSMPTIFKKEFKPSMITPTLQGGIEIMSTKCIIGLGYRIDILGTITESPIYETKVSNQTIVLTVRKFKLR